jgi:hypothetical protein
MVVTVLLPLRLHGVLFPQHVEAEEAVAVAVAEEPHQEALAGVEQVVETPQVE